MQYKFYIYAFDAVFKWSHLITKPAKWIIKGFTSSRFNHMAYGYTYAKQGNYIKESTGHGFGSKRKEDVIEKRYSKIWVYELTCDLDFPLIHKMTKEHIGDEYEASEAAYSAIDRIPVLNKIYRLFFKIKKNDKDFSYCNKAILLILKANGYLLHIKDDNSLNPEELIKEMQKHGLCKPPVLVWDKNHYVNKRFDEYDGGF